MAGENASDLGKFLKDFSVHEVLSSALSLKGLETVDDSYPGLSRLDTVLSSLSEAELGEIGTSDPLHGVHAAKLRKALRVAHNQSHEALQAQPPQPSPPQLPGWRICLLRLVSGLAPALASKSIILASS